MSRAYFWKVWSAMVIRAFIFIFLFRTKGKKEHLNENFCHCYDDIFESAVLKVIWSQLCLRWFLNNNEGHWQRCLRDTSQLNTLQTWINIRANSFLVKHHDTKIGEGAWKIISCTKTQACTSKNIAPKYRMNFHLSLYASSFLKQT